MRLARFACVRLLRHALPISLLILRKKPTVLQSKYHQLTWYNSLRLWRWVRHRLSKRQSLLTTTVLFGTTFTRTIKHNLLLQGFVWEKTYRFCNQRKWKYFDKKQLTLLKMCSTSLLCSSRVDLWPFYGLLGKRFSLYIKVYQGWRLQRSGPMDPLKENGRKFAPTAPIASKFHLGNTR